MVDICIIDDAIVDELMLNIQRPLHLKLSLFKKHQKPKGLTPQKQNTQVLIKS